MGKCREADLNIPYRGSLRLTMAVGDESGKVDLAVML